MRKVEAAMKMTIFAEMITEQVTSSVVLKSFDAVAKPGVGTAAKGNICANLRAKTA